ncbi:MAG: hypothetical protein NTX59_07700 [Elusimicrobia bacterium]|nr:hypothetical protein [Elusimicrobiota bacterium]
MRNIVRLLLLTLCFGAVDVRAMWIPMFQIDEMEYVGNPLLRSDYFQYMVRPYRDRTERFRSARVEALQMGLAVNDESDQLTLENWGDNRADIRSGSSMLKAGGGVLKGTTYSGSAKDQEYSGNDAGVYGRFGTFEAEGSYLRQKARYSGSSSKDEYEKTAAGAGFSLGGEGVRLGLHGNMNEGKDPDSKLELPNQSAGAALALRAGIFELGTTADYVDRGVKISGSDFDIKRSGPQLGAQAMIKPFKGLKAALRASVAKLSGDYNSFGYKADFAGDNTEFGMRAEWKFEAVPLTLAFDYEKLMMTPEYKQGNFSERNQTENRLKSSAAAFHFFGGRFLLGVEAQDLKIDSDFYNNNIFASHEHTTLVTFAGGTEVWLLPWFGVRGSFKRMDFQDDITKAETFYNAMAAGVGLKGKKLSLDVSARKMTGDNKVVKQNEFTDVKATLACRF